MTSDAYRTISLAEITAQFSAERKARIKSRATELLDAHLALEEVSEADAPASSSADIKLSTLREYVSALGGELHLVVTFPDHAPVALENIARRQPPPAKRKRRKLAT